MRKMISVLIITVMLGVSGCCMEMMQAARLTENVKFVIMTGGAKSWSDSLIDCNRVQTFLLDNSDMLSLMSRSAAGATHFSGESHCIYNTIDLGMLYVFRQSGAGTRAANKLHGTSERRQRSSVITPRRREVGF